MAAATIELARLPSPIGDIDMVFRAGRLCALAFVDGDISLEYIIERRFGSAERRAASQMAPAVSMVQRYFEGDIRALHDVAVDVDGTPFQRQVWATIHSIRAGETASYRHLARTIGRPSAVRAVGTAMGANPVGLVIPCHRVVRVDGGLGGYGGGTARKRWLLEHERLHPPKSDEASAGDGTLGSHSGRWLTASTLFPSEVGRSEIQTSGFPSLPKPTPYGRSIRTT